MVSEAYTDETVELVATATDRHYLVTGQTDADRNTPCACGGWADGLGDSPSWDEHMARVALDALAAAGLLVPAGAKTREVWAYPVTRDGEQVWIETWCRVARTAPPGLSTRTEITTDWVEVRDV